MTDYGDHTYCFVCEKWTKTGESERRIAVHKALIPLGDMEYRALRARGIHEDTCRKYRYTCSKDTNGSPIQVAEYVGDDGRVLFQKTRDKDKNFCVLGAKAQRFFGQNLYPSGKKLIVTEGEIDCLTVSQVQDNKYPVVSIPFGCQSAHKVFKENLDWLLGFEEVIVMFDSDEAGQKAIEKLSGLLPLGRMKVARLPLKDPNECLLSGHPDYIIRAIWNADDYRPDGIMNAKDMQDILLKEGDDLKGYEFPWADDLTRRTQGIRKGEMLLLTAGSGIGKSTIARELAYTLHMRDHLRVGMVMLEESPKKTLRDLMSIHLSRPLHLMWNDKTKAEVKEHYGEVFGDGGFLLYDHFGSIESNRLLDKIRYMIVAGGCDFVVLDHITIAVTTMEDGKGDERSTIDRLMTALRSLVEETGAGLIIISHLRKTDSKSCPFEQGGSISMDDLRGSGSLKQLPDTIIAAERNQQAEDEGGRNKLRLRLLKCRFTGETGLADAIRFDKKTNRLHPIDPLDTTDTKGEEDACPF
jgi:twinkle protein